MLTIVEIKQDAKGGRASAIVSADSAVANLILLGMLPKCRVKDELLAAYDGNDAVGDAFTYLSTRYVGVDLQIRASLVWQLEVEERVALIKGISYLVKGRLASGHCICDMRPIVTLPVAAFASLLQDDLQAAHKAWSSFSRIPRLCAERLKGIGPDGLAGMSLEDFIETQAGGHSGSLSDKAKKAGDKMIETYQRWIRSDV